MATTGTLIVWICLRCRTCWLKIPGEVRTTCQGCADDQDLIALAEINLMGAPVLIPPLLPGPQP